MRDTACRTCSSARELGLEVFTDVSTPRKAQSDEYAALVERIVDLLRDGKAFVIHCRGGLERTGTVRTPAPHMELAVA